jgi:hypothetical protein
MNILFKFYRLYFSIAAGATLFFTLLHQWWALICGSIFARIIWHLIEKQIEKKLIDKTFEQHAYEFKQQFGPYGIRLINKAESDYSIKKSLAEVFTSDSKKLKETADQLSAMDTLFNAGFRPEGDTFLLHELKLKYCKYRLEKKTL